MSTERKPAKNTSKGAIEATPTLKGKDAEEFIMNMIKRSKGRPTKKDMEIFRRIMFMPDGKTPRCHHCGNAMHNVEDSRTGKLSKYLWRCECMPPDIILSVG